MRILRKNMQFWRLFLIAFCLFGLFGCFLKYYSSGNSESVIRLNKSCLKDSVSDISNFLYQKNNVFIKNHQECQIIQGMHFCYEIHKQFDQVL